MPQLPKQIIDWSSQLIGAKCTKQLLIQHNFKNRECINLAVSKAMSVGIVLASGIVKLPQIYKIIASGSAQGVSFVAHFVELIALSINFSYNLRLGNSFTSFGETLLISAQNAIIIGLIGIYSGQLMETLVISVIYSALMTALLAPGTLDAAGLKYLQVMTIPLVAASRLPQLFRLLSDGQVGQVSPVTVLLMALGSSVRVFTSWQEMRSDKIVLAGAVVSSVLNWAIALTALALAGGKAPMRKPLRAKTTKQD